MESAALEAYKKDIEENGDLSASIMRQKLSQGGRITKLWNEAKGRDGKSYYVNVMTKETIWHTPPEGYMSLQEQREQAEEEATKQLKDLEKYKRKEGLLSLQQVQQEEAETAARLAREKMKERRVVDDIAPVSCGPLLEPGKTDPYGKWQVVQESTFIDLQLPAQETYYEEVPIIEYEPEPVVKEFKEKTIDSLGTGETSFKRRKLASGAKHNSRQRTDDE